MGAHTLPRSAGSQKIRLLVLVAACLGLATVAVLYVVAAVSTPNAGGTPVVLPLPPVPADSLPSGPVNQPTLAPPAAAAPPPSPSSTWLTTAPPLFAAPSLAVLPPAQSSVTRSTAAASAQPVGQPAAVRPSPASSPPSPTDSAAPTPAAPAVPAAVPPSASAPAPIPGTSPAEPTPTPAPTPAPEPDPSSTDCARPGRDNPDRHKKPYKKPLEQKTPDGHTVCVPAH